ncbi:YdiU family protein [Halomonas sp. MCCC 1A17488]|uniref:protein adenylyltransferase SelO n=1 Tax=unclassified Halomonas TaxID=2609666 RepID=UPI0018D23AA7|nr:MULTISPECIES: YdiU family protein [unclassified Halomonas]MCE8017681.1 YdiU family protein [Halomonas sp. MCCC 1A17488]MCG3241014.1 YdiU family protein [Halomonas sp. MCCC 1A17488]QPP48880.1 YdiU family protein [Halomonas sp. SS10-MC5]
MFPPFTLRYARLPERFYARFEPVPVREPHLIAFNRPLAEALGFDLSSFDAEEAAVWFSGNVVPHGAEPLAQAYAGHQFGGFVPQLGDGRAVLLGEVTDRDGRLRDIQLKGAGRTPFSRGGDGRAPLGPVLREYLVSEAMHAMGIPSTRALAAVTTGEHVVRGIPEPGAILTRVAASHIRVGTFQYFAARGDIDGVRELADHAIERHYPELTKRKGGERYLGLLEAVQARQAGLIAKWMGVGFIHGVMNTDNTSISGETIDFGPCAFMEQYDPQMVFSSIDEGGRYAYANQPWIAQWNLARLAETLLPLIDDDSDRAVERATELLQRYPAQHEVEWLAVMRAKLGLQQAQPEDKALIEALLASMHRGRADFTLTFRRLADAAESAEVEASLVALFERPEEIAGWLEEWRQRLAQEPLPEGERTRRMRLANPAFIPRNHRVQQALTAAMDENDFGPFETLLEVVTHPFDDQPGREEYTRPAEPTERVFRTFCGT